MKAAHLILSLVIVACTAAAWFLLGAALTHRSAVSSATMQAEDDDADEGVNPVVMALSVIGLLGAAAVLFLQVSTASIWINADDNSAKGEWSQLF